MEDHLHLSHPCYTISGTPCSSCATDSTSCTTNSPTHTTNSTRSYASVKLVPLKPEFVAKPDEDAESHLLRTNDWMDTHAFPEGVKVQRFCLM